MTILHQYDIGRKIFLRRFGAYSIDMMLLIMLVQGAQWGIYALTDGFPFKQLAELNNGWLIYGWVFMTVSIPIWFYFILLERSSAKGTPGKRVMGLCVMSANGEPAQTHQIISRTIIKLVPWEIFHLAFMLPTPLTNDPAAGFRPGLMVGWVVLILYVLVLIQTPLQQSVHDLIAKTVVDRR